jgi:hypothetical protein
MVLLVAVKNSLRHYKLSFITKTQGFDEKAARMAAKEMMVKLPAWKNHV